MVVMVRKASSEVERCSPEGLLGNSEAGGICLVFMGAHPFFSCE
jgi:hypothetical protein